MEEPKVNEVITTFSHFNPLPPDELWGNFLVEKACEEGVLDREKVTVMSYDFVEQKSEKPNRMEICARKGKNHVYSKLASSPYYCSEIIPGFAEDALKKITGCYAHVPRNVRKGWRERGKDVFAQTRECETLHECLRKLRKKILDAIGISAEEKPFSEASNRGESVIERFYELYSRNEGIENFHGNIDDEKVRKVHARNLKEIFKVANFSEKESAEIKRTGKNRFEVRIRGRNGRKEREYALEQLLETRAEDILPETSSLSLTNPWLVIVYGDRFHIGGRFFANYAEGLLKEILQKYGRASGREAEEIESMSVATTHGCEVFSDKAHVPVLYIVYGGKRIKRGLERYFSSPPEVEWGYGDFKTKVPKEVDLRKIGGAG